MHGRGGTACKHPPDHTPRPCLQGRYLKVVCHHVTPVSCCVFLHGDTVGRCTAFFCFRPGPSFLQPLLFTLLTPSLPGHSSHVSQVPVAHRCSSSGASVREEAEPLRFGAPGGGQLELTDSRVLWVTQQGLLPRRVGGRGRGRAPLPGPEDEWFGIRAKE